MILEYGDLTATLERRVRTTVEQPAEEAGVRPIVQCDDFSVLYDGVEAVSRVSLRIPAGIVTAIIGPSGCGKSTLLRAMNRMNDLIPGCSVRGRLCIDGVSIYSPLVNVAALRQRVAMVFQKPNPFPKSIFDNVAYGPRVKGIRRMDDLYPIVERSLRRAALWSEVEDRLNDNALGLSGGQQQRLCIARALAVGPEIVLMDEPTSALDPGATACVEELINELRGQYTVILVTHNMAQAARVSDFTGFMYLGELIEMGATDRMFTSPSQPLTQRYITGRFG